MPKSPVCWAVPSSHPTVSLIMIQSKPSPFGDTRIAKSISTTALLETAFQKVRASNPIYSWHPDWHWPWSSAPQPSSPLSAQQYIQSFSILHPRLCDKMLNEKHATSRQHRPLRVRSRCTEAICRTYVDDQSYYQSRTQYPWYLPYPIQKMPWEINWRIWVRRSYILILCHLSLLQLLSWHWRWGSVRDISIFLLTIFTLIYASHDRDQIMVISFSLSSVFHAFSYRIKIFRLYMRLSQILAHWVSMRPRWGRWQKRQSLPKANGSKWLCFSYNQSNCLFLSGTKASIDIVKDVINPVCTQWVCQTLVCKWHLLSST